MMDGNLLDSLAFALALACALFALSSGAPAETAFPDAAWEERSPASMGLDEGKLHAAVEYLRANSGRDGVRELVIIRSGVMIWRGDNVDHVHGVWSLTKSFTSTVLGLLSDDGKASLDTRASAHLPEMTDAYPEVTLRHFTTMTSGYRAIGDEPQGAYLHGPSKTPFLPSPQPLFTPPGSHYAYWDSAMSQFGHVLTRLAQEPMADLFRRRIAEPIGMGPAKWDWGVVQEQDGLAINGGSGNAGKHVRICARELARFGLLMLHRGNWRGRQLLSPAWVDAATSVQVPADLPLGHPESNIDGRGVYGFNWWCNALGADGKRRWPGVPVGAYAASGYNNNDLFVIPEWDLVIVRLGLDESTDGPISTTVYAEFLRLLGEALPPGHPAG